MFDINLTNAGPGFGTGFRALVPRFIPVRTERLTPAKRKNYDQNT